MTAATANSRTRRTSARREWTEYDDTAGDVAYISVWVDGVQVAAGVKQDEHYARLHFGAQWSLWSTGLSLRASSDAPVTSEHTPAQPHNTHPLPVRDEHDVRAWLTMIANLTENGPRAVQHRAADPVVEHVERVARDAGLEVMGELLTVARDRGDVEDAALWALDADTVEALYDRHVGPAVDGIEDDLTGGDL